MGARTDHVGGVLNSASYAGGGGLEPPIDVVFGPDGTMCIVDFGWNVPGETDEWIPGTGVIWRATRE